MARYLSPNNRYLMGSCIVFALLQFQREEQKSTYDSSWLQVHWTPLALLVPHWHEFGGLKLLWLIKKTHIFLEFCNRKEAYGMCLCEPCQKRALEGFTIKNFCQSWKGFLGDFKDLRNLPVDIWSNWSQEHNCKCINKTCQIIEVILVND